MKLNKCARAGCPHVTKDDGSVVSWGYPSHGGDSSSVQELRKSSSLKPGHSQVPCEYLCIIPNHHGPSQIPCIITAKRTSKDPKNTVSYPYSKAIVTLTCAA